MYHLLKNIPQESISIINNYNIKVQLDRGIQAPLPQYAVVYLNSPVVSDHAWSGCHKCCFVRFVQ